MESLTDTAQRATPTRCRGLALPITLILTLEGANCAEYARDSLMHHLYPHEAQPRPISEAQPRPISEAIPALNKSLHESPVKSEVPSPKLTLTLTLTPTLTVSLV